MTSPPNIEDAPQGLLDYRGVAQRLGIPVGTVYGLVCQRRIPHVRLGPRFVRFDPDEVDRWVDARRVSARDRRTEEQRAEPLEHSRQGEPKQGEPK